MLDWSISERSWARGFAWLTMAGALALCATAAQAHKASDAYLNLAQQGDQITLRVDIALRDLDAVLPLDSNNDGRITWGEVKARQLDIEAYVLGRWSMRAVDGVADCVFKMAPSASDGSGPVALERRIDGTYEVLNLQAHCPSVEGRYAVRYGLMQGVDPTHRGLLKIAGDQSRLVSLSPGDPPQAMRLQPSMAMPMQPLAMPVTAAGPMPTGMLPHAASGPGDQGVVSTGEPVSSFGAMWRDGIHHILIGTDHVLFLLCLLLPSVLRRSPRADGRWALQPVAQWRSALAPVLMTITMFTLAHSITLALAALKLVTISPRVIEPAIALTIALAAIDNLHPIFRGRRHLFTFLFGLIHGFGFAGVLTELDLPLGGFVEGVLAFNLGVETGQLLVVLPAMLLLLKVRHWSGYAHRVMPVGSILAMAVAAGWFVERVFDLSFMPI